MPHRAPTACSTPRCPGYAVAGSGRCAPCGGQQRRAYDHERGSSRERGYDKHHRKRRLLVFARDGWTCQGVLRDGQACGRPVTEREAECDHVVPIKQGGSATAMSNQQTLCRSCHARKTADERNQ